jgi:polyferredoxin
MLYTALYGGVGIALVAALFLRQEIGVTVAPVRNPTFVTLADGSVRNAYEVRLRNMNLEDRVFHLSIGSDELLRISLEGTGELTVRVPANQQVLQRVYVTALPDWPSAGRDRTEFRLWVEDLSNNDRAYKDTVFNGRSE